MTTEIIKTDDPNIVIERTVIEREINVANIREQIAGLEQEIELLTAKKEQLENADVPELLKDVVNTEITKILGEIYSNKQEIARLNNLIA